MTKPTDDQLLAEHDRNVQTVAEAVFGLVAKFAPQGMTPVAVFEGALKGAALAMALHQGDTPADIADLLDEAADAMRAMPADAFKPAQPTRQ